MNKMKDYSNWNNTNKMTINDKIKCKNCDDYGYYEYYDESGHGYYSHDGHYEYYFNHKDSSKKVYKRTSVKEEKEKRRKDRIEKLKIAKEEIERKNKEKEIEEARKFYDSVPTRISKLLGYERGIL